ncbi:MAG: hypothetical protein CMJ49_12700 [Planctomycetaceae bacterium]|nr:hypothetical protein [Planctomycetaceae bacterium]
MIVDLHTHLWQSPDQLGPQISAVLRRRWPGPWDQLNAGAQAHRDAMEPVDVAVVLGFRSQFLQADVPNETISAYVAENPGHVIGFAGVDPMEDRSVEQVDEAVAAGLSGLTISPAAQDFHPSHSRAMRLYEKAAGLGLPVLIHQGSHFTPDMKLEYARPYLFDEVARAFPALRLVIAHGGYPWLDETLVLIGKHEHVYTELSDVVGRPWKLYNLLLEAHQMEITDRLLFGSGFPYGTPQQAIETLYSMNHLVQGTGLPSVPRQKIRAIVERDALQCLGLTLPVAPNVAAADRSSQTAATLRGGGVGEEIHA